MSDGGSKRGGRSAPSMPFNAILGIIFGSIAGVLFVAVGLFFWCRLHQKRAPEVVRTTRTYTEPTSALGRAGRETEDAAVQPARSASELERRAVHGQVIVEDHSPTYDMTLDSTQAPVPALAVTSLAPARTTRRSHRHREYAGVVMEQQQESAAAVPDPATVYGGSAYYVPASAEGVGLHNDRPTPGAATGSDSPRPTHPY